MNSFRLDELSLNVDSLIGTKVDSKVTGLMISAFLILWKAEIFGDKSNPSDIAKT